MSNKKRNRNSNPESNLSIPKSREARQKLRRWTFIVEMKLESGEQQNYAMPGLVYGDSREAHETAAALLQQFKEGGPDTPDGVRIVPVGHETVSPETRRQLLGLQDQAKLATSACFVLAEKYRKAGHMLDEAVDLVKAAHDEARDVLFPRLKQAEEKVEAIENTDFSLPVAPSAPEEPKVKRKIGREAYDEIMAAKPETL